MFARATHVCYNITSSRAQSEALLRSNEWHNISAGPVLGIARGSSFRQGRALPVYSRPGPCDAVIWSLEEHHGLRFRAVIPTSQRIPIRGYHRRTIVVHAGPNGEGKWIFPTGTPEKHDFTIVFFHGLENPKDLKNSSDYSRRNENFWPAKWLTEDFPTAHILTVSYAPYDLKGHKTNGTSLWNDFAGRLADGVVRDSPNNALDSKVILVGHSVGGLMIKKMLLMAQRDPHSSANRLAGKNLRGIFYYGTPMLTDDMERLSDLAKKIRCKCAHCNVGNTLISLCTKDADDAKCFMLEFKDGLSKGYKKISSAVFEETETEGETVVRFGDIRQFKCHDFVNADHFDICKATSIKDPRYKFLKSQIETWIK